MHRQVVNEALLELALWPDGPLLIKAADTGADPTRPDMEFVRGGGHVAVGSGPSPRGGGEVWLVRYDPRPQEVDVRRGENRGQTLVLKNVVREIVRLGTWSGRPKLYRLPPETDDDLTNVVLLQGAKGGRILGVLAEKDD